MENLNLKQKLILGAIAAAMVVTAVYYIIQNFTETGQNYEEFEVKNEEANLQTETKKEIKIHIAGCVEQEGIITLEEGSRIADAIEKAGGTTLDANLKEVNLAFVLKDGQKLYIPSNIEEEVPIVTNKNGKNVVISGDGNKTEGGETSEKININTATQTELETLSGIGPSIALKIIAYRESNGEFGNIEELKNVPGIGEAKYEAIKENIEI